MNEVRQEALIWWRTKLPSERVTIFQLWSDLTKNRMGEWDFQMINSSTLAIECIYREIQLQET